VLWEIKDNKFALISLEGPNVGPLGLTETIVMCLNLVVSSCVMNQSMCHWLLFDALTIVINLTMAMELCQILLLMG